MKKKKYTPEQKSTLFVSVATAFITTFMGSALNLSVPDIEKDFGVNAAAVGWVVTIYMLTCAALAVPFGRMADGNRRKRVLWTGILIFWLCSAAGIFSFDMWALLMARFGQGIGASMIFSTNIAILVGAFEKEARGKALGYSTSSTYAGLSAGPVLGGFLNHNFGWRAIFTAAAVVSAVAFYSALKKLPEDENRTAASTSHGKGSGCSRPAPFVKEVLNIRGTFGRAEIGLLGEKNDSSEYVNSGGISYAKPRRGDPFHLKHHRRDAHPLKHYRVSAPPSKSFSKNCREDKAHTRSADRKGTILYIAAVAGLMYGFSTLTTSGTGPIILIAGAFIMLLFIRNELKQEEPIIDVRMFYENLPYAFSNLAALLNYGATYAVSYLISIYLQMIKGFDSQTAGLVLIASPLIMALLSPVSGRLSDKYSPYKMSSLGMGFCAVGLALFSFLPQESSLTRIIFTLSLTGIGFALFTSPNTNAVMASVEKKDYGIASSVLATMRSIGHTVSMAVVTLVMGAYLGDTALSEADEAVLMDTIRMCFYVFTALCAVGIFIALRRKT